MRYIERLLQRQAQMAARIERQSAPALRLYPEALWIEKSRAEANAEDQVFAGGVQMQQTDAAEEVYRELVRLQTVREQVRTVSRQAGGESGSMTEEPPQTDAAAVFTQGTGAPAEQIERRAFGFLSESHTSRQSMERISRFFERDARRYGG